MYEHWWDADEWDTDLLDEPDWELRILEEERRRVHYVDGVPITGRDYPACLEEDALDCERCSFFFEDECRLRRSKRHRDAVWEIIRPWVEWERRRQERRDSLRRAIADELQMHGRELHYVLIAKMVQERHPKLGATEQTVLRTLCSFPDMFEQLSPGVYRIAPVTSIPQKG